jgi:DHA1 family multidrug resistance protein-like MFS transporter
MNNAPQPPLLTKRLALFLVAMLFIEASRSLTIVQIPVYLRELGASVRQVGLFFTIALIFPLLLRVVGGWVSDRIGRLRALLIGCFAGALTFLVYAFAFHWHTALLAPALLAVSTALTIPSYYAYIGDTTVEATRGRVFGLAEAVRTSAWIFSPPLGGALAQNIGYKVMFLAASGTFLVAMLIFMMMTLTQKSNHTDSPMEDNKASLKVSFRQMFLLVISGGLITWILITDGVRDIALKLSFDLMPVYLTDVASLTKQDIGLLDGVFGIAWVITSYPAGWLVDKTSERVGVVFGICAQLISQVVFVLARGFRGFALSWAILGIGGALLDPAFSSLIARGVPQRLRGVAYGLVATSLGLISLPFPWIGGQLWTQFGAKAPFVFTIALGVFSIIPAWLKLKIPRNGEEDSGEANVAV